jgi:hypothetical protein
VQLFSLAIRCRILWKDEVEVQRKRLCSTAYCIDVLEKTTKFLDIMGLISFLSRDSKMEVPVTRRKRHAELSMLDNADITFEMLKYLLASLLKIVLINCDENYLIMKWYRTACAVNYFQFKHTIQHNLIY